MASRIEILNDGGFRSDGRRQFELRDISIDFSLQGTADGSVTIHHGLTQVLVSVFGPREAKLRSQTIHDRANINVEVTVAAFSTGERRKRSRGDKRLLELASTIKSTFEPVVQTHLYPRSQIDVFIQVLQLDGGLLPACINGTTLALTAAGIPLFDFVCAITGGVHSASPMLDLTTLEENDIPHITVAMMPRSEQVTLVTMETRLHVDRFEEIFRLAVDAGRVIHNEMRTAIQARTGSLVASLGSGQKVEGETGVVTMMEINES
ncbi:exoribonuclease, exosome component 4 [Hygrophoropsis aurantiaca]|uniref:Exoribonuclease, exosome component 4 n=1 Tax=Hygrophoropsis aurantiaca TaxID=72124 RepID=A0ACB8AFH0_9AGAM|nr:exoribonuclease, exosome component 4 [Hygrophoropsis aurantiaca]